MPTQHALVSGSNGRRSHDVGVPGQLHDQSLMLEDVPANLTPKKLLAEAIQ